MTLADRLARITGLYCASADDAMMCFNDVLTALGNQGIKIMPDDPAIPANTAGTGDAAPHDVATLTLTIIRLKSDLTNALAIIRAAKHSQEQMRAENARLEREIELLHMKLAEIHHAGTTASQDQTAV